MILGSTSHSFESLTGPGPESLKRVADRHRVSSRIYLLMGGLFVVSAVFDWDHARGWTTCLSGVGLAVASVLGAIADLDRRNKRKWLWYVAYGSLWASTVLALAPTGGAESPFFGDYMVVLLLCGICILTSIQPRLIFLFVLMNVIGWFVLSSFYAIEVPSFSRLYMIKQSVVLMLAAGTSLGNFLLSWKERNLDFQEQTKRLLQAESELIHADRMAEVGKLVATTAHELAQPTQVIVTVSSLFQRIAKQPEIDPARLATLSDRLFEAAERLSRLLGQLKSFSRKETAVAKVWLDLAEPLRSVNLLIQHDLKSRNIAYRIEMPSSPLWTFGDAHRLQQVFLNLVNNARDAALAAENPRISISVGAYREWARVTISNNGGAMPLGVQAQLFKPYFTTKSRDEGTGLGLSICLQLVEEHEGRILFSSHEDETLFVVDLPRRKDEEFSRPGLYMVPATAQGTQPSIGTDLA